MRCFEDQFHIYVEHRLVAKFAHYVPMNNISHVYVNGDVRLYGVSWEGKFYVSTSYSPPPNQTRYSNLKSLTRECLQRMHKRRKRIPV
ncbi:unnamed protein product [Heligmosomoides polygyrus]|uniref:Galectin n=1 Tax=Heligmosomoides polygyrus TaxID=6339 RepID=A0A183FCS6_HELPZ|nr:unnamed protein product [Heligmosomoides polygyrus]